MSYVVTIQRSPADPITPDEFRQLVDTDPEFEIVTSDYVEFDSDVLSVLWKDPSSDRDFAFVLSGGEIEVTTPSSQALTKMQAVAAPLSARVIGEEGEDLTDVEPGPDVEVTTTQLVTCFMVLLLLAGLLVWLLFFIV